MPEDEKFKKFHVIEFRRFGVELGVFEPSESIPGVILGLGDLLNLLSGHARASTHDRSRTKIRN